MIRLDCFSYPNDRTPLANSPDWLKSVPMQENLLASWRQSGQKQDPCPSLLNHNAKYKRLLPPYCDFANGVRPHHGQAGEPQCREGRGDALGRAPEARRFKQQGGKLPSADAATRAADEAVQISRPGSTLPLRP